MDKNEILSRDIAISHVGSVDEKTREKLTEVFNTGVESNIKSTDFECNPEIGELFRGMANAKEINPNTGKKQLLECAKMISDVTDKAQDAFGKLKNFYMEGSTQMTELFNAERGFCRILQRYGSSLKDAKNTNDLNRMFRTVQFEYKEFLTVYKKVVDILGERQEMEPKSSSYKFWSLTKWIWNYKYALYITGLLLYNITLHVFPGEIQLGVDLLIKIAGSICFTFASDRASMTKLLGLVISLFMITMTTITNAIPFVGEISKQFQNASAAYIPKFIQKSFSVAKTAIFYLMTHMVIEQVSYITSLVCQGIVIFGGSYSIGKGQLGGIWEVFANASKSMQGGIDVASEFIGKLFSKGGAKMVKAFASMFISTIYQGVLVPAGDLVKGKIDTFSNVLKNPVSSMLGYFTSENTSMKVEDLDETLETVSQTVYDASEKIPIGFEDVGSQLINSDLQISLLKKLQGLSDKQVDKLEIATEKNIQESVKQVATLSIIMGKQTLDEVKEKIDTSFQDYLKRSGSEALWSDISSLKFPNSFTPYIITIMFMISVMAIVFR